jgi:hypothetical protein
MRPVTRNEIRQAGKRGLTARRGSEADLPLFFDLMEKTCSRQRTAPNPSSVDLLAALWEVFNRSGTVLLFFAESAKGTLAGCLCIAFGGRMTIWKKGWNGEEPEKRPNHLVYTESIRWAREHGFGVFDFASLDREIALALLEGRELDETQKRSRDTFHLGFAGDPVLLPRPRIWLRRESWLWLYCFAEMLLTRLSRPNRHRSKILSKDIDGPRPV